MFAEVDFLFFWTNHHHQHPLAWLLRNRLGGHWSTQFCLHWLLKKQKEPWAWWVGESLQTSRFLWVTFFCYYRNRELPSSSHLWDTQAFFSQESPVKAWSNTVFIVFLCRSGRLLFLWDSWVLSVLILLWLGRFTYIASDFKYGSFKMIVSSVFGYQVFRSI